MAASEHGQLPAVQCLLQAGARLDADMQGGTQAIHLAAMCGHAEVVRLLCEHGAEADASTDGGTTPLMLAAMEGHVDVCLELHAQGADANAIETSVIPELEQQIAGLQHEVIQARVAAGVTVGEGGASGEGQTDEVADANADSISAREACTDGGQDGVLSTVALSGSMKRAGIKVGKGKKKKTGLHVIDKVAERVREEMLEVLKDELPTLIAEYSTR